MLMYSWERKRAERSRAGYPNLRARVQGVKAFYRALAVERSVTRSDIDDQARAARVQIMLDRAARLLAEQRDHELDVLAQKVAVRLRHWGVA